MRKDEEAKKIWFSGDFHLSHAKIVEICSRPTTIKEHDQWLIDRINSRVNKKDEFYILGDVSMISKIETEKLLHKIHGKKHLILGNHDDNIKNSTIFQTITQIRNFNFHSPSYENVHIVLCHYPFASWERKVYGTAHLHGHTHGRFDNSKNGLSFDIGIDANDYYPLNLEEVFDKLTKISINMF